MEKVFDYLNGQGGFIILGLIVVVVLLYKKIRNHYRYKRPNKK